MFRFHDPRFFPVFDPNTETWGVWDALSLNFESTFRAATRASAAARAEALEWER